MSDPRRPVLLWLAVGAAGTLITITANTEIADRRTGPPRVTSE